MRPDLRIGFFLHTPFPDPETLRTLPRASELVHGLLGADTIGLQTAGDVARFARSTGCRDEVEPASDDLHVAVSGQRRVRVRHAPASIDATGFARLASCDVVSETARAFRALLGGRRIVLGVDRLDYTKALPDRLAAYERLLDSGCVTTADTVFVQLAIPTRESIPAYVAERAAVEHAARRIEERYPSRGDDRRALLLHVGTVELEQLAAMYRAADVMVVSPRRDGMNLVAKEYCAAQAGGAGALVLTAGAGAAAELTGAVLAPDHRAPSIAAAVVTALDLPPERRRQRMATMHDHVLTHDATHWARSLLTELEATARPLRRSAASGLLAAR